LKDGVNLLNIPLKKSLIVVLLNFSEKVDDKVD
jgi:hypothetical protein